MRRIIWTVLWFALGLAAMAALYACAHGGDANDATGPDASLPSLATPTPLPRTAGQIARGPVRSAYVATRQAEGRADPAYALHPAADGRSFTATHPVLGLREDLDAAGLSVGLRGWRATIAASAFGCADVAPVVRDAPRAGATPNRVEYAVRAGDTAAVEWFSHGPLGMEHGFTFATSPCGAHGDDIEIDVAIGGLSPVARADGNGVDLADARGTQAHYTDLSAHDADGKPLGATMQVAPGGVALRIDARGARYPVEVDPLTWGQQTELTSDAGPGGSNDDMGISVAISGGIALVGASNYGFPTSNVGAAYVFVQSGTSWTLQAKLSPPGATAGINFGSSVALAGTTALVGAYDQNGGADGGVSLAGAAYVYVQSGTTWPRKATLTASNGATGNWFGYSVALSGGTAVIGAVSATVGTKANAGAAYVFQGSGAAWSQKAILTASDPIANGVFGTSVAISGTTVVVGATGDNGGKTGSVANAGAAYVYVESGSTWPQQAKLVNTIDGAGQDNFGAGVGIDTDTVIVGANNAFGGVDNGTIPGAGAAYIFQRSGTTWSSPTKLYANDGSNNEGFGISVAIAGSVAVVGSYTAYNSGGSVTGAAYAFTEQTSEDGGVAWTPDVQDKILAKGGGENDDFGYSVAISGDDIIVGAIQADGVNGAAYVFALANGSGCTVDTDCVTGFCASGYCCNTACPPLTCQACNGADLGWAGASNGKCTVAPLGYVGNVDLDDAGSAPCSPYVCAGPNDAGTNTTCPTSCTSSATCATNYACSAGDACLLANGQTCPGGSSTCATGFCSGGYCCNAACNGGPCEACNGAVLGWSGATNGTCATAPTGFAGSPTCSTGYACDGTHVTCPTTCSTDTDCLAGYFCASNGQCTTQKTSSSGATCAATDCKSSPCRECASGDCVDGYCCNGACNQACEYCDLAGELGTCTPAPLGNPGRTPCSTYACDGNDVTCPTSNPTCLSDAFCEPGYYCNASGKCVAQLAAGSACNAAAGANCLVGNCRDCASGTCLDGFCCGTPTCASCQECTGAGGTCVAITNGPDPDNCSGTQTCNASGVCTSVNGQTCTSGSTCSSGNCVDGHCCGTASCGSCQECTGANGTCATITNAPDPDNCTGTKTCNASGVCTSDTGQACTTGATCATGNCVDGVCCVASACATCQMCDLAGSVGTCATVTNGPDPDSCTAPNTCNAEGKCALTQGEPCAGSGSCASGFCVDGYCCNGPCGSPCQVCAASLGAPTNGTCGVAAYEYSGTTDAGVASGGGCAPYVCPGAGDGGTDAGACETTCASDSDCATGFYCNASGVCATQKTASSGATCATTDCKSSPCRECTTGNCENGYCCNTACGNGCDYCNIAGHLGTCTVAPAGDPGSPTCPAALCNGTSTSCVTGCTSSAQCEAAEFCNASGQCEAQKPTGATCAATDCAPGACPECASGNCVDGFCCNNACGSECEACDVSGVAGTCTPVPSGGLPHGSRTACPTGTGCSTPVCNGTTVTSCAGFTYTPNGTTCGANVCNGVVLDAQRCDGAGHCTQVEVTSCDPNSCSADAGACGSGCTQDSQCASNAFCSGGSCVTQQVNGAPCTRTQECQSGACVDGYCCNSACNGECQACDVSGDIGTCSPVTGAPHGSRTPCAAGAPDACSYPACNGSNTTSCAGATNKASGTSCGTSECSGTLVSSQSCDGNGNCDVVPTSTNCAPFQCSGGACTTSCTTDSNCASGAWCSGGVCVEQLASGGSCTSADQCAGGNCVDGYCCNSACAGQCQACDVAGAHGSCVAVTGSPHGARAACSGATACATATCNGSNQTACAGVSDTPAGTTCGTNVCSGTVVDAQQCDGAGNCQQVATATNCDPFPCTNASCGTSCSSDANCASDGWCNGGVCVRQLANGQPCSSSGQCDTAAGSVCVDGYCCNSACSGQCQACDVTGLQGTCAPVTGAPHGARASCGAPAPDSCTAPACNGSNTASCAGTIDLQAGVSCGSSTCNGNSVTGQVCDGNGNCSDSSSQTPCDPGLCTNGSCTTQCSLDSQCASDGWCNNGVCAAKENNGTSCPKASACTSGNCVDGYCCGSTCTGDCQACDVTGALGSCVPVTGKPHGDRPACPAGATACASPSCDGTTTATCNGVADAPKGASCGANTCVGTNVESQSCDGAGNCTATTTVVACDPFECAGGVCTRTCTSDSNCASDAWCSGGVCTAKLPNGGTCTAPDQCTSTTCVDGYCCNSTCGGECQACDVAGIQGTCAPVTGAPHGSRAACPPGTSACSSPSCDGTTTTSCTGVTDTSAGVPCGANVCAGTFIEAETCNGAGTCEATPTSTNCDPFLCSGGACTTSCTSDSQCAGDGWCNNGVCASKQPNGASCSDVNSCQSGLCVDGYCCSNSCTGECEACDESGAQGTCVAVTGAPHGARAPCPAGATVCSTPTCDGNTRTSCTGATLASSGVSCGANVCVGTNVTAQTCNGAGACDATNTLASCDPFQCSGGACSNGCTTDANCAADGWCNAGQCAPKGGNGTACSVASACTNGNCVDGYCCSSACSGECQACDVAGAQGSCVPVAGKPHGSRPACPAGSNVCAPLACNGTNVTSCAGATDEPQGFSCGTSTCSGTIVSGQLCDGAGNCTAQPDGINCDPALCTNGSCTTSCVVDTDCAADGFCNGGVCAKQLENGATCPRGSACTSGICADGVCCNTACGSQCEACDSPGALGTCVAISGSPHGSRAACQTDAGGPVCSSPSCDGTTVTSCTGTAESPAGTVCGAPSCNGTVVDSQTCDGLGNCRATTTATNCDPFLCANGACTSTCSVDADCASDAYCAAGTCLPRVASAQPCTSNDQCSTNFCVDGVCCNSACEGQCSACNSAAAPGTCTAIVGPPVAPRPACQASGPGDPCSAELCDGIHPASCNGFVGASTPCGSASCSDGGATLAGACDGNGNCKVPPTVPCETYACGDTACKTICTGNTDCATGYSCDTSSGKCTTGTSCLPDGVTIVNPSGTQTSCAPYKCVGGACVTNCTSVDDCANPAVCDPTGACVPPSSVAGFASTGTPSGSCGCEAAGAPVPRLDAWLVALAAALLATRRRKRASLRS